jgi:hypothetical protein
MSTSTKPSDLRVIPLNLSSSGEQPPDAPTRLLVTVGVEVIPYLDMTDGLHGHPRLCLLHPDAEDSDPLYLELSTVTPDPDGVESKVLRTTFTVTSSGDKVVARLLALNILETVEPQPAGASTEHPVLRLALSDREVAKRCGDCGRWESPSNQARLATCSSCKLAWYVSRQFLACTGSL